MLINLPLTQSACISFLFLLLCAVPTHKAFIKVFFFFWFFLKRDTITHSCHQSTWFSIHNLAWLKDPASNEGYAACVFSQTLRKKNRQQSKLCDLAVKHIELLLHTWFSVTCLYKWDSNGKKTLTDVFVCTKRHLTRLILIEYIDN